MKKAITINRELVCTAIILCLTITVFSGCTDRDPPDMWPLEISEDRRYLVDQQQKPFFIQAETAWKLFNELSLQEMDTYLDNCLRHGFNTVLFVFRPFQGATNTYGEVPFMDDDITRPNEAYWVNVDSLVIKARNRQMLLFGVMLWHKDDQNSEGGNRRNPLKYDRDQCRQLGKFLGGRYHAGNGMGNVIFVGGGDKRPGPDSAKYAAMADAVLQENPDALITYHAYHPKSSCDEWGYPGWLALNAIYNYQPPHSPQWIWQEAHNNWRDHGNRMPLILYEGLYENESRKGYRGTPFHIRKQHWWAVTSGCTAGHAFGHRNIWTMTDWKKHLGDEGRNDMMHIGNLMKDIRWWDRIPDLDNTFLVGGLGPEEQRATACLAQDGSFAVVYTPNNLDPVINSEMISLPAAGRWLNPRTGEYWHEGDTLIAAGSRSVPRPDSTDWVLVIRSI